MAIIEGSIPRGQAQATKGLEVYVDTVGGSNNNSGTSGWSDAKATMAAALAICTDHSTVYVVGDIREQINMPLGVQGIRIIGAAGGNTRHDDGVRWRAPASPTAATPLLTLREQGSEIENILFVADANAVACVRVRRAEDATWPDGSHAIFRNCKFTGNPDTPVGIGIDDYGGGHHVRVENCEFNGLVTAIDSSNTAIANPLRWVIENNFFEANTNHIVIGLDRSVIKANVFDRATTTMIDISGGGVGKNFVIDNVFEDDQADIDNAHGYTGHASDAVWRNFSKDTAAATVGVPGA